MRNRGRSRVLCLATPCRHVSVGADLSPMVTEIVGFSSPSLDLADGPLGGDQRCLGDQTPDERVTPAQILPNTTVYFIIGASCLVPSRSAVNTRLRRCAFWFVSPHAAIDRLDAKRPDSRYSGSPTTLGPHYQNLQKSRLSIAINPYFKWIYSNHWLSSINHPQESPRPWLTKSQRLVQPSPSPISGA